MVIHRPWATATYSERRWKICATDADCGSEGNGNIRGACGEGIFIDERGVKKGFSPNVCTCNEGFTGPHCLAIDHVYVFIGL